MNILGNKERETEREGNRKGHRESVGVSLPAIINHLFFL